MANDELLSRLDVLIKLTALGITREKKQAEAIALLALGGLKPKEIAELLGTTPNTVSVALSSLRKKKK